MERAIGFYQISYIHMRSWGTIQETEDEKNPKMAQEFLLRRGHTLKNNKGHAQASNNLVTLANGASFSLVFILIKIYWAITGAQSTRHCGRLSVIQFPKGI